MVHYSEYNIPRFKTYEYRGVKYADAVLAFDTETTTFFKTSAGWVSQGNQNPDDISKCEKYSLVYIWQLAIDNDVVYGRNIDGFFDFVERIHLKNPNTNFIIYVHNLGYDFSFIYEIFRDFKIEMFARAMYKPIYFRVPAFEIEFRCSYFLTNMSLEDCARQFRLNVQKCSGFLDYTLARTPVTPLTVREIEYCEMDVRVIVALIRDVFIKRYGNVAAIPITQTGEVRREFKKMAYTHRYYIKDVARMKNVAELYPHLRRVLQGGYTHLNAFYNGMQLNNISSYDLSSSYPAEMCFQRFPMTKFCKCRRYENPETYAYLMYIKITKLKSRSVWNYIARHKCDIVFKGQCDNGKLVSAEYAELWVTDVDYEIIRENYTFENVDFLEIYRAVKKRLPKFIVEYVLSKYIHKTTLKGVDASYAMYMREKQMLNGIFGMCITNTIRPEVKLDHKRLEWREGDDLTREEIFEKYNDQKPFLNFAWGIWVTAYARADLWSVITKIGDEDFRGMDCVYCDTDSAKIRCREKYEHIFDEYNRKIDERAKAVSAEYNIPFENFRPKNIRGEKFPLGYFCYEGTYDTFISLGSKKYCTVIGGKIHCTVAGLRKSYYSAVGEKIPTITDVSQFAIDSKIPMGRTVHFHNPQSEIPEVLYDYVGNSFVPHMRSGICLLNTFYTFSIERDYSKLVLETRNKYADFFRLV